MQIDSQQSFSNNVNVLSFKSQELVVVRGIVEDQTGAIFPNAKIKFKDKNGKIIQTAANEKGEYTIQLPAGNFVISVEAEVNSLLFKNKESKIEIRDFNEKNQNLTLYCVKGNCTTIVTFYCG